MCLHFAGFSPLFSIIDFASPMVVCDSIVIKVTVVGDFVDPRINLMNCYSSLISVSICNAAE